MNYQRVDRLSEEVQKEVDDIIRHDLKDPRIGGTYSVTRCEVTRDLRYARVYVSVLEDDRRDGLMEALKKAAGYVRRELGHRLQIRYIPEVQFIRDENIAYGVHIAQVLSQVSMGEEEHAGEH